MKLNASLHEASLDSLRQDDTNVHVTWGERLGAGSPRSPNALVHAIGAHNKKTHLQASVAPRLGSASDTVTYTPVGTATPCILKANNTFRN
jgi:hypothetical protein